MPSGRTPCQLGSAPRSLLMLCLEVTFRCNEPWVSQRNRLELAAPHTARHRLRPRAARSGAAAAPSPSPFCCFFFLSLFIIISWQRRASPENCTAPSRSPGLRSEEPGSAHRSCFQRPRSVAGPGHAPPAAPGSGVSSPLPPLTCFPAPAAAPAAHGSAILSPPGFKEPALLSFLSPPAARERKQNERGGRERSARSAWQRAVVPGGALRSAHRPARCMLRVCSLPGAARPAARKYGSGVRAGGGLGQRRAVPCRAPTAPVTPLVGASVALPGAAEPGCAVCLCARRVPGRVSPVPPRAEAAGVGVLRRGFVHGTVRQRRLRYSGGRGLHLPPFARLGPTAAPSRARLLVNLCPGHSKPPRPPALRSVLC